MPEAGYLFAVVGVAAAVTLALRAAPFTAMATLRSSALVNYVGRHLPAGIMLILVLFLLRDVPLDRATAGLTYLGAIAVTVAVHLWRRQALLSMVVGTVSFGLLLAVLPA